MTHQGEKFRLGPVGDFRVFLCNSKLVACLLAVGDVADDPDKLAFAADPGFADREVERLAGLLADPDLYDQPERIAIVAKEHDEAAAELKTAVGEWENLIDELELIESQHA